MQIIKTLMMTMTIAAFFLKISFFYFRGRGVGEERDRGRESQQTPWEAAKIFMHLLYMQCSTYFTHSTDIVLTPTLQSRYYYYCSHFIDEKKEVQSWIKRIPYLPGEIIKTIDLEVTSTQTE